MIISDGNTIPLNTNTVALKLFRHIANEWGLSPEQFRQIFMFVDDKQFEAWKSGNLNTEQPDLLILVSRLMAIYQLLHQIFQDPVQANAWMSKPSNEFRHFNGLGLVAQKGIKGAQVVQKHLESQLT